MAARMCLGQGGLGIPGHLLAGRWAIVCTCRCSAASFTGTELDFALDVSNAVIDVWGPLHSLQLLFESACRRPGLGIAIRIVLAFPISKSPIVQGGSQHLASRP